MATVIFKNSSFKFVPLFLPWFISGCSADSGQPSGPPLKLHMMRDKGLAGMGAVCAGFYFAPVTDPTHANDWQLYFQGGGWCLDAVDCWARSKTTLGSSNLFWPWDWWPRTDKMHAIMSGDCAVNPDFCSFNRVHMIYCDGNSFSGDRETPLTVTGLDGKTKSLYFRGKRILDATLQTLASMGLNKAENVLLTGSSAGGLATFLHADYVHERLQALAPSLERFKAAPLSGFFLMHDTVEGKPVYQTEMKEIFEIANSTQGVNGRCVAALDAEDRWKCNFAEFAYAHTTSSMFVVNSALDSWQVPCIYTSEFSPGFPNQTSSGSGLQCGAALGWAECVKGPEFCNTSQIVSLNQYISDFESHLEAAGMSTKPGNGAFIHSCYTHVEAEATFWNTISIDGVSMQEALSKWWNAQRSEPASLHTYAPCHYHTSKNASVPYRCNPTCAPAEPFGSPVPIIV